MTIETITQIWNEYWWAFFAGIAIIIIAILARNGMLHRRLNSLFGWPPSP